MVTQFRRVEIEGIVPSSEAPDARAVLAADETTPGAPT